MTPVRQELSSVGQAALGFTLLGLVLVGISGTIYKVISPEGWVAQMWTKGTF